MQKFLPASKRPSLRAAVAGLLASALVAVAACGGGSEDGSTTASATSGGGAKRVTLQFVGPETPESFAPVIAAFEQRNPNIKIKYTSVPFDQLNSVLQQRLAARNGSIDVFTVDQPRVSALAARGFLAPLDAIKGDARSATLPNQLQASEYQGKLYALPIWTSEQFLYYNKDLLKKAGVKPPTLDPEARPTWEQVQADAQKAKAAGARWGLLLDQIDRYYQLQPLAESAGGGPGLTGDDMLTPDLQNSGWEKAMRWYAGLFTSGLAPRGVAVDQMIPTFASGKAAFLVSGPWAITQLAASKDLDWGIAPHPYFAGGKPATPTDSWSWGIDASSKNKDAAMKFLEFASLDQRGNEATIAKIFIPPANAKAFEAYKAKLDEQAGSRTKGAADLMEHELAETAVHRPRSVGYTQFEDIMLKAFGDIRNGADPASRLAQAQKQVGDALTRLR